MGGGEKQEESWREVKDRERLGMDILKKHSALSLYESKTKKAWERTPRTGGGQMHESSPCSHKILLRQSMPFIESQPIIEDREGQRVFNYQPLQRAIPDRS